MDQDGYLAAGDEEMAAWWARPLESVYAGVIDAVLPQAIVQTCVISLIRGAIFVTAP